jgi:hypothetical protein
VIELAITGAGSGLCDAVLEVIESVEGDFRLRLIDGIESAGEARRFQGRTIVIELDNEADLDTVNLVFDLNQTYIGDAERFRPTWSFVVMMQRLLDSLANADVLTLHGVVREPAVEKPGGVEALAGQVTQLFNGRDPDPQPFGGSLAFNTRTLDDATLVDALSEIQALQCAEISLERLQSDSFYTAHASLWMQLKTPQAKALVTAHQTDQYRSGFSVSPDSGRVGLDAAMTVYVRELNNDWVHVMITADLEKTIWAQEAKQRLARVLEKMA